MKLPCSHHPDYYFLSSDKPIKQKVSFNSFLFNDASFFINSTGDRKKIFYIINQSNNSIAGRLNLTVIEEAGYSPYKAPFGGIEFEEGLKPEILKDFLLFIKDDCIKQNISSVHIKLYPEAYNKENSALLINAFLSSEYNIQIAELNQHIEVNEKPLTNRVNYAEKKRIKKCLKAGFKFNLSGIDDLQEGFKLIKESRDRKGYPTSMSFGELEDIMLKFPQNYLFFTVKDGEKIIALSISIKINNKILYNFYHAHDPEYDTYSPVAMVVHGVYNYCQSQKMQILDLGISTNKNVLNNGLYRFKKNLGARTSIKFSFIKNLL